jgi:hypothetical protein
MKKLILTAILLGFGTGLALAEGDSGGAYAYRTQQQVQHHDYSVQFDQNGEQIPGIR